MNDLNEKLKGWRTQIAIFIGIVLSSLETLTKFVEQFASLIDIQMTNGGAATSIIALVVGMKALFTDTLPKLKGNLDRTN